MANIYRDVTLQNVSENDIGKQMKVSGWVENIRDHGGVSFIDLRDMYGVLHTISNYSGWNARYSTKYCEESA